MFEISVDTEVYNKLGEIAIPFKETTPNMVLRRLLDLSSQDNMPKQTVDNLCDRKLSKKNQIVKQSLIDIEKCIVELKNATQDIHPAFLTILMDKFYDTKGNYKTSYIVNFMEKIHLKLSNGQFYNPWMKAPYSGDKNGLVSCQRTIEHFRQTRRFGCWGGQDEKSNCKYFKCKYHPESDNRLKNKCDLRNGVIWKRSSPDKEFSYGKNYLDVIKKQLLNNKTVPLELFLKIVYPNKIYNNQLIGQFKKLFNFNEDELSLFFKK